MSLSHGRSQSVEPSEEDIKRLIRNSKSFSDSDYEKSPRPVQKVKTFNRLDERFQWNPSLDENHIFPEEYDMIKTLRADGEFSEDLAKWKEKSILYFLIARRHNMTATKELLRKHLAKMKELGFHEKFPTFESVRDAFKAANTHLFLQRAVDKHERILVYYRIRYEITKKIPFSMKYALLFWETMFTCDEEPLRYLRNGIVVLIDMENFSWKNLDLGSEAKEFNSATTGMFPRRVRAMYIINGGPIVKLAVKASKLVLSKKITKRIQVLDKKGLKDLIPDQFLLKEYGGSNTSTFESAMESMAERDKHRSTFVERNGSKTSSMSKSDSTNDLESSVANISL